MYLGATSLQSTRPPGSDDLEQDSKRYSIPDFALLYGNAFSAEAGGQERGLARRLQQALGGWSLQCCAQCFPPRAANSPSAGKAYSVLLAVEPKIVIEVVFNNVMQSQRHGSGYSLRFPRILRPRPDKPVEEIDTLDRVADIFHSQSTT